MIVLNDGDRANNLLCIGWDITSQVASKTNDAAGDGTTTATVLTRAIFREGCKVCRVEGSPVREWLARRHHLFFVAVYAASVFI